VLLVLGALQRPADLLKLERGQCLVDLLTVDITRLGQELEPDEGARQGRSRRLAPSA
jgi:hypothetical protein